MFQHDWGASGKRLRFDASHPFAHAQLSMISSAGKKLNMALSGFSLNKDRYLGLLEKLIGETEFLQDNPPKLVPQEDKSVAWQLSCPFVIKHIYHLAC